MQAPTDAETLMRRELQKEQMALKKRQLDLEKRLASFNQQVASGAKVDVRKPAPAADEKSDEEDDDADGNEPEAPNDNPADSSGGIQYICPKTGEASKTQHA